MNTNTFREVNFFRWLCEDEQADDVRELIMLWKHGAYYHLITVWGMPSYLAPREEQ